MNWEQVESGDSRPGESPIRHDAAGFKNIDVCFRASLHPAGMVFCSVLDGAGNVEVISECVNEVAVALGDRVAHAAANPEPAPAPYLVATAAVAQRPFASMVMTPA